MGKEKTVMHSAIIIFQNGDNVYNKLKHEWMGSSEIFEVEKTE